MILYDLHRETTHVSRSARGPFATGFVFRKSLVD